MKKVLPWVQWCSAVLFLGCWTVIGIRLLLGHYDFVPVACASLVCWAVFTVCVLLRFRGHKCPYCGKRITSYGIYCPHCGKRIDS